MIENYLNPHPPGCYWHQAAETFGAPNLKWCEQTLCHAISEPSNTWSNLAYIAIAIIIFISTRKTRSMSLRWVPFAFLLMGVGSFFYHASNFYISQIFDFVGMYFLVHWFIAINLMRAKLMGPRRATIFYINFIIVNILALHIMYLLNLKFQVLIAIAGLLVVATEWAARKKNSIPKEQKWLVIGVILIVSGEVFSLLDLSRTWCDPTNHIVQGHAIWHVLSAIGLFFAYKHFEQFEAELP